MDPLKKKEDARAGFEPVFLGESLLLYSSR